MSSTQTGRDGERQYKTPGSVKRAREQVQAMMASRDGMLTPPRTSDGSPTKSARNRGAPTYDPKAGQIISRPTQVPQWPLGNNTSIPFPSNDNDDPNISPPIQIAKQAPKRPPRPSQSRIPSMLDQSKPQQPTPVFFTTPAGAPETPVLSPSESPGRQGTIPDFPPPGSSLPGPPRKSAVLGPPPSSRRGLSTFYSNSSFVSPIPEESPRSKSHGSYASSAAMPETWPNDAPENGAFYEDSVSDESRASISDEYGDESTLVRNASLGKKGKPALINTKQPVQATYQEGDIAVSISSESGISPGATAGTRSSETIPTFRRLQSPNGDLEHGDGMLSARALRAPPPSSSSDFIPVALADPPRRQSRLSALRRPLRLDMDAVRAAEARGSLTSLPDLIRRATRLASMIDKGNRPASRLDALGEYRDEKDDRHRSGLSDMLAAFPPPGHSPRGKPGSPSAWLRNTAWPAVPPSQDRSSPSRSHSRSPSGQIVAKPKRRCCGLPLWGVIFIAILLVCLIVAAIVVPLEFFVFKNLGNQNKEPTLAQCQKDSTCLNGGTSIISQGKCSCICTNGFTGATCGDGSAVGCSTTNLVSTDGQSSIRNVTLGRAIPRLLVDAGQNFSISLSGTTILARINAGGLSCVAQNSLVTLDGRASRSGQGTDEVDDITQSKAADVAVNAEFFPIISIITIIPAIIIFPTATVTRETGLSSRTHTHTSSATVPDVTLPSPSSNTDPIIQPTPIVTDTSSTISSSSISSSTTLITTTSTGGSSSSPSSPAAPTTTGAPGPGGTGIFIVTEERLDFARIAILFILQEESLDNAIAAQSQLQRLFSQVTQGKSQKTNQPTDSQASKLDLGNGNIINLVDFNINIGKGPVGRKNRR